MTPKKQIEVQCDEDGDTFVCFGTMNKRKALQEIKSFMDSECGIDEDYLPKLDDLRLNPLWYGADDRTDGDEWYWWGNPPENAEYLGSCWRYDVCGH